MPCSVNLALGRAASLRQAVAAWGDRLAHPGHEELALTRLRHLRRLREALAGEIGERHGIEVVLARPGMTLDA